MIRALRVLAWIEAALFVLLALTGLWLTRYYRPTSVRLYSYGDVSGLQTSLRVAHAVRALHALVSIAFIWIAGALALICIVGAVRKTRETSRLVAAFATGFAVLALATSFTGYLLPWDQLALRAVTINSHYEGLWKAAFSDQIRFAIIGSTEISQATLRNWFIVHSFVLPIVLTAVLVMFRRRYGDQPSQEPQEDDAVTES